MCAASNGILFGRGASLLRLHPRSVHDRHRRCCIPPNLLPQSHSATSASSRAGPVLSMSNLAGSNGNGKPGYLVDLWRKLEAQGVPLKQAEALTCTITDGVEKVRRLVSMPEVQGHIVLKFAIGLYIAFTFVVFVRHIVLKGRSRNRQGSVSELVKRGQLRPGRRDISQSLEYEDPFNNPLVKVSKMDSTIEMCGKVYSLAPVTLTDDQQSVHKKRRSRAYQWKKPTVFLKEGDSIPPDVDPETVRWVPSNHPFATTVSDIDEEMAQKNIYQKHGVPSRIRAEHEALHRKLDAIQNENDSDNEETKPWHHHKQHDQRQNYGYDD